MKNEEQEYFPEDSGVVKEAGEDVEVSSQVKESALDLADRIEACVSAEVETPDKPPEDIGNAEENLIEEEFSEFEIEEENEVNTGFVTPDFSPTFNFFIRLVAEFCSLFVCFIHVHLHAC